MTVFGTRPEGIKMAPIVKELEKRDNIESVICITAQHREMLDQVLNLFNIEVDYDLNIFKPGQSLTEITTRALEGLEEIIKKEEPDLLLVQGGHYYCICWSTSSLLPESKNRTCRGRA